MTFSNDDDHSFYFTNIEWPEQVTPTASFALKAYTLEETYGDYECKPDEVWGQISLVLGPEGEFKEEDDFQIILDLTLPQAIDIRSAFDNLIAYLQQHTMCKLRAAAQVKASAAKRRSFRRTPKVAQ